MPGFVDLTGRRYGSWVVLRDRIRGRDIGRLDRVSYVFVRCDCGLEAYRGKQHIRDGQSTRCMDCYRKSLGDPSCPCGEARPEKFLRKGIGCRLLKRCIACDRRHHRNGSCETCGVAKHSRGGEPYCKTCP